MLPTRTKLSRWRWLVGRLAAPLLFAGAATFLVACLQSSGVETGMARLEREAYSWHLLQRPSRAPDPRIELVVADDPAYEAQEAVARKPWGEPGPDLSRYAAPDCLCRISRACYARAVRRLTQWGARAVVLDMMFRRPCPARGEDADLIAAVRQSRKVVVAAPIDSMPVDRTGDPLAAFDAMDPLIPGLAGAVWGSGSPRVDPRDAMYAVQMQQTVLDSGTKQLRQVEALPLTVLKLHEGRAASDTGWVREWAPALTEGADARLLGSLLLGSRLSAVQASVDVEIVPEAGTVLPDEVFFPRRFLINFSVGSDAAHGRYTPVRLSTLLALEDGEGKRRYGGKLVFIGNASMDRHRTAVGALPGMEILANATATLLQHRPIVPVAPAVVLLWMFALSVVAAAGLRALPVAFAGLLVLLELFAIQFATHQWLARADLWLMPASPSAAVLLTAGMVGAWESRRVQRLVGRLLPRPIAAVMERHGGFHVEGGTVLFSDIRGYSTFSEYMDPASVMTLLNEYFGGVHEILDRYRGHFVKSPGDCLMAWFAVERRGPHHAERALRAALEIVEHADRFHERWAEYGAEPFLVGVGINSGQMAVGILDARRHIEPTVIGDSVNLAARIEAMTHADLVSIMATEETVAPVRDRFHTEFVGEVHVGGRSQRVRLYRVLGYGTSAGTPAPSAPVTVEAVEGREHAHH